MTSNSCNHFLLSIIQLCSCTSIYTFLIHNWVTYNGHNNFPSSNHIQGQRHKTKDFINKSQHQSTLWPKVNPGYHYIRIKYIYYTLTYWIYTRRFHLLLLAFLIFLCYLWFKASYTLLIPTSTLLFTSSYHILILTFVQNTHTILSSVRLSTP